MLRALIPPKGKLIPFFKIHFSNNKKGGRTKREVARDGAGQGSTAPQGWLHCREKARTPLDALPWGAIPLPTQRGWPLSASTHPVECPGTSEVHLPGATREKSHRCRCSPFVPRPQWRWVPLAGGPQRDAHLAGMFCFPSVFSLQFWGVGDVLREARGVLLPGSPFLQYGMASGSNRSSSRRVGQAFLPQTKRHKGTISLSVQPADPSAGARCLRGAGG